MLAGFCVAHSARRAYGLGMAGGLLAALGALAGVARIMIWSARRLSLRAFPYVVRQGLANLYRPRNRTLLLTVVLGSGAVLILTVQLTQSALRREFTRRDEAGAGNTILMDAQTDQLGGLSKLMREKGMPIVQQAPVVAMRLASVNGVPVEKLAADKSRNKGGWAYRREYRSSYSAGLREGEKLVAGQWPVPWSTNDPVAPVSIEAGIARELGVGPGDRLGFDVQGVPVAARVASVREVEWRRVQPNFFVIFPPGAVDEATSFHILVTRTESPGQSADFQRAVLRQFPNISIIDLRTIIQTIDSMVAKAEAVIRFMAAFTLLTGLVVLAGAMANSRRQRIGESVLLRTLGATKRQLLQILAVEYAALGALAGAAATGLATTAAWSLCHYMLKIDFAPSLAILPFVWLILAGLAMATGLIGAGRILDHPPLEVLRSEG
jgi:putative ABC transport system permease protein